MTIQTQSQLGLRSNPNLLINGDFSVWQRGTYQDTAGYGSADRFRAVLANSATMAISRNEQANGHLVENQRVRTSARIIYTTATEQSYGSDCTVRQVIEDGGMLTSGESVTVGVWLYTTSNAGDEFIIDYSDEFEKHTIIYGWNYYSSTFAAKDRLGSPLFPDSFVDISFIGSGDVNITQVKAEVSSVATPFEPDDPQTNLAKCQRYYQGFGFIRMPFAVYASGYAAIPYLSFNTAMRKGDENSIAWATGQGSPSTGWVEERDRIVPHYNNGDMIGFDCIVRNTSISTHGNGWYAYGGLTIDCEL